MPISSPWDLVIASPVPASVVWWPLSQAIQGASNLGVVLPLVVADLTVEIRYDTPAEPQPGRLVWRGFTALVAAPVTGGIFPYTVGALGIVEMEGGAKLLGVFNLTEPQYLWENGKAFEVKGFMQVTKYQ
jgi:hypothetical protein